MQETASSAADPYEGSRQLLDGEEISDALATAAHRPAKSNEEGDFPVDFSSGPAAVPKKKKGRKSKFTYGKKSITVSPPPELLDE